MLQVSVKGRSDRRARETNSQTYSCRKRCPMGSEQLVNIIVEVGVEQVFTEDPVGKERDNCSFENHQNLDRAWSDRLHWTPRRTQFATGLYAHDDNESTSSRAFEKIVPLLRGLGERNVTESAKIFAGRALPSAKVRLTYSVRIDY